MEIQHVEVLEDEEPYREVKRSQVRNEEEDDIKIMKGKHWFHKQRLTLSFLSRPASHLCHEILG
jgi:hypothetical protein